jgi:hypothetical protein
MFVDFLVTKHGLAEVLRSDDAAFQTLHAYFIDRLVPVLLRGVGNLCVGAGSDPRYDPRHVVGLLIAGLRIQ